MRTPTDWQRAADDLAALRSELGDAGLAKRLGVPDDVALRDWIQADAVDTLLSVLGVDPQAQVHRLGVEQVAAALCAHTQIGIELGLWLANTGRICAPCREAR